MKKISFVGVVTLLIDIISKLLIINNLKLNTSIKIIEDIFSLTYVQNTGAAWSILSGNVNYLIIINVVLILLIIYFIKKNKKHNKYEELGYGLLLGGAFGNLLDRVIYGYVIDFLDFTIIDYHFPIFNIADSCIVIGIVILLLTSWRKK